MTTLWTYPQLESAMRQRDARSPARREHPETSQRAAQQIVSKVPSLEAWAAECVRQMPDATRLELEQRFCPHTPNKLGRRLDGAVKRVSGHTATTWRAGEASR